MNAIMLTDAAATYIKAQLAKNPKAIGFRLATENSGCSNKRYVPSFVETVDATDEHYTDHDIDLYVPQKDLEFLEGTLVDCVKNGLNKTLAYNNPNAIVACGCGESFDIKKK